MGRALACLLFVAVLAWATPASAQFDRAREERNYSKTKERSAEYNTPEYQAEMSRRAQQGILERPGILAADPERRFEGNLCTSPVDGCAGDVRFFDWEPKGHGISRPLLFTARNGATISGRMWATRAGPAKRPGIVITSGSVQAPEQLYWFAATNLAKRGYVVFTWDPQGQGRSDTPGEGVDAGEGVPSQQGRPFYDNTEDALDFFFSTPSSPYSPRKSCTTGTSHAPKQSRRVAEGKNAAHNPLWEMLDGSRVGVAGHSFGAAGVSFVGQRDPRVDAIVAWDNLATPSSAMSVPSCASAPETRRPAPITKPGLGMSNDYGLTPTPYRSAPDPQSKNAASRAYSAAGVDTGQLNIRGGTHYEYSYIPSDSFGATLRGMDLVAWYTTAWFDKYVKRDRSADSRLATTRWRDDRPGAAVDPDKDGNLFSFYLRSRLDLRLAGGGRLRCEDMRNGRCALRRDCEAVPFSYVRLALTPDRPQPYRACPAARTSCLPRRLAVSGRRIGPARLGRSSAAFNRRHRRVKRARSASRYCVRGGGRFLMASRKGKITLVASTARGHRTRSVGPGRRVRGGRIKGARRIGRGLLVGHRMAGGRVIYGVRRGRVRFLAVVPRRQAVAARSLARRLRSLGLR